MLMITQNKTLLFRFFAMSAGKKMTSQTTSHMTSTKTIT